MNCLNCGVKNPATGLYCQKCGQKLDLSAEEVRDTLAQTQKQKLQRDAEYNSRRVLILMIVLFLMSFTAFVASGGLPKETSFVPSCSAGSPHVRVNYRPEYPLESLRIPLE